MGWPLADGRVTRAVAAAIATCGAIAVFVAFAPFAAADGTAQGPASFHDPSNACGGPPSFTDNFEVTVSNGTISLKQLSNGVVATGPIDANGNFTARNGPRTYTGRLTGSLIQADHTFDLGSCVAAYKVDMELNQPISPTPPTTTTTAAPTTTTAASQATTTTVVATTTTAASGVTTTTTASSSTTSSSTTSTSTTTTTEQGSTVGTAATTATTASADGAGSTTTTTPAGQPRGLAVSLLGLPLIVLVFLGALATMGMLMALWPLWPLMAIAASKPPRRCACIGLKAKLRFLETCLQIEREAHDAYVDLMGKIAARIREFQDAIKAAEKDLEKTVAWYGKAKGALKAWRRNLAIWSHNEAVWAEAEAAWRAYQAKCAAAIMAMLAIPPGGEGMYANRTRISATPIEGWIQVFPGLMFWAADEEAAEAVRRAAGYLMRLEAIKKLQQEWDRADQQAVISMFNKQDAAKHAAEAKAAVDEIEKALANKNWKRQAEEKVLQAKEILAAKRYRPEGEELDIVGFLGWATKKHDELDAKMAKTEQEIAATEAELKACLETPDPPPCPDCGPAVTITEYAIPPGPDGASVDPMTLPAAPTGPTTEPAPAEGDKPPGEPPTPPDRPAPEAVPAVPVGAGGATTTKTPPKKEPPKSPPKPADPGRHSPVRRELERALDAARAWLASLEANDGSTRDRRAAQEAMARILDLMAQLQDAGKVDFGSLSALYSDLAVTENYLIALRKVIEAEEKFLEDNEGNSKYDLRPNRARLDLLKAELAEQERIDAALKARLNAQSPLTTPPAAPSGAVAGAALGASVGRSGSTTDTTTTSTSATTTTSTSSPTAPTSTSSPPPHLTVLQAQIAAQQAALAAIDAKHDELLAQLDAAMKAGRLTEVAALTNLLRELTLSRAQHVADLGRLAAQVPASVAATAGGYAAPPKVPVASTSTTAATTDRPTTSAPPPTAPPPATPPGPTVDPAVVERLDRQVDVKSRQLRENQETISRLDKGGATPPDDRAEIETLKAENVQLSKELADLVPQRDAARAAVQTASRPVFVPPDPADVERLESEIAFWDRQIDEASARLAQSASTGDAATASRSASAISAMEKARGKLVDELVTKLGLDAGLPGTSGTTGFDPSKVPPAKLPEVAQLAGVIARQEEKIASVGGLLANAVGAGNTKAVPAFLADLAESARLRQEAMARLESIVAPPAAAPAGTGTVSPPAAPITTPPPGRAEQLRVDIEAHDRDIVRTIGELANASARGDGTRTGELSQQLHDLIGARDAEAVRLARLTGDAVPQVRHDGSEALGQVHPTAPSTAQRPGADPSRPPPPPPPPPAGSTAAADPARYAEVGRTIETLQSAIARSIARGEHDVAPLLEELKRQQDLQHALGTPPATTQDAPPHTQERPGTGAPAPPTPPPITSVGLPEDQAALVEAAKAWTATRLGSADHPLVRVVLDLGQQFGADRVHDLVDRLQATTSTGAMTELIDALVRDIPRADIRIAVRAGLVDALTGILLDPDAQRFFGATQDEITTSLRREVDLLVDEALRDGTLPSLVRAHAALDRDPAVGGNPTDPRLTQVKQKLEPLWREHVAKLDAEDQSAIASHNLSKAELERIGTAALSQGRFATAVDAFTAAIPRNAPIEDQVRDAARLLQLLRAGADAATGETKAQIEALLVSARSRLEQQLGIDQQMGRAFEQATGGTTTPKQQQEALATLERLAQLQSVVQNIGLTPEAASVAFDRRLDALAEDRNRLVTDIRAHADRKLNAPLLARVDAIRAIELGVVTAWGQQASLTEVRQRLDELFTERNGTADAVYRMRNGGLRVDADDALQKYQEENGGIVWRGMRSVTEAVGVDSPDLRAATVRAQLAANELTHNDAMTVRLLQSRTEWRADEELEKLRKRELRLWQEAQPAIKYFMNEGPADRIVAQLSQYRTEVAGLTKALADSTKDPQRLFRTLARFEDEAIALGFDAMYADQEVPWYKFGLNRRTWTRLKIDTALSDLDKDRELAQALRIAATTSVSELERIAYGRRGTTANAGVRQLLELLEDRGFVENGRYVIPEKYRFTGGTGIDAWIAPHWTDELFSAETLTKMAAGGAGAARVSASLAGLGWSTLRTMVANAGVATSFFRYANTGNPFAAIPIPGVNATDWLKEYAFNLATLGLSHGLTGAGTRAGVSLLDAKALESGLTKWAHQMTAAELRAAIGAEAVRTVAKTAEYSLLAGWERLQEWSNGQPLTPFWELMAKNAVLATYLEAVGSKVTEAHGGFRGQILARAAQDAARAYGPTKPPPEYFARIDRIREQAAEAYTREVDRLLDNSRFRRALDDVTASSATKPPAYRQALDDLAHEASGGHGPMDLPALAERLWRTTAVTDPAYREALQDVQGRALTLERPTVVDEHDRAQLDAKAEEIRRAAGSVDVSDVFKPFESTLGPAREPVWRTILSDPVQKDALVRDLRSPDLSTRRGAAIRFLHEAGSWIRIKGGLHSEFRDVADLLFTIRSEVAEEIMRDFDANLIGTVKSMQNDADYNFKLFFGDGRRTNPIDNMLRASERMQQIVDQALGTVGKGNWELIWESNFYLDPKILHLHTMLETVGERSAAWKALTRDSAGLFLEIQRRMHVPEPILASYEALLRGRGVDPGALPTTESMARALGLDAWSGAEGRRAILVALNDAMSAFFATDAAGRPAGNTLENALRVVRLNMLLNVESEGAYVPPGAGYVTVTVKEGSASPATKPFKADLGRLKVPEEYASAIKQNLAEIDRLRAERPGDPKIEELLAEVSRLTSRATEDRVDALEQRIDQLRLADPNDPKIGELTSQITDLRNKSIAAEVGRRQTQIAEIEADPQHPLRSDLVRLQRELELLMTPGGFQRFTEYLKQELETVRLRDITRAGTEHPEIALQSVMGDILFYQHIMQGARFEGFWGTQRYELFKYASRVLEIARALGIEHQYLPLQRYLNKAAQIYEDHTPAEQFPGDPFSRAEDLVLFERTMQSLQLDVVRQLLKRAELSAPAADPARTQAVPATVDPNRTQVVPTEPATVDPARTQAVPAEPVAVDPNRTQVVPTEPAAVDPNKTHVLPTDPNETAVGAVDPNKTHVVPTDPNKTAVGAVDDPGLLARYDFDNLPKAVLDEQAIGDTFMGRLTPDDLDRLWAEKDLDDLVDRAEGNQRTLLEARRSGVEIDRRLDLDTPIEDQMRGLSTEAQQALTDAFERAAGSAVIDKLRQDGSVLVRPITTSRDGERILNPDYRLVLQAITRGRQAERNPVELDMAGYAELVAELRVRLRDPAFVELLDHGVVAQRLEGLAFVPLATEADRALVRRMVGPLEPMLGATTR